MAIYFSSKISFFVRMYFASKLLTPLALLNEKWKQANDVLVYLFVYLCCLDFVFFKNTYSVKRTTL